MKRLISLIMMVFAFSSCQHASQHQSEFPWKPYSKQAIENSAAHHKPVVIDFFAEWCPNCHDLDREVYSRPEIQAQLAQVTALRMDATNQDDSEVQKILQEYEIEGLPTVIFLDSHGKEIKDSRLIGLVTPKEFSQAFALLNLLK